MISQKTVQQILETAKVEEIVEEYVNLKRRGVNLLGLCPFHNEKTPSFTVSPAKNIYKCFGCGKGGNAVQFLMEHENFTFPESLVYLAKKYNIEIEETQTSQENIEERQYLDSLFIITEFAKEYYADQLLNTAKGKSIGLSYFKERGFREETIKKFGLGFAPEQKDIFTLIAVKKGFNIELLRKIALTTQYNTDFFRNRVLFPIHNLAGKVIGFGGRTLQKDKKIPKYINSPETEIYNKSKVLYGAFHAKKAIRQQDECVMVEGYTDVISLNQAGIENVVSSSGTSLTVGQIRLVKRYTPNIKIIYDGDTAGVKAALRGLDLILEQDMNVKVVLLPDGEDPDSYLQKVGSSDFKLFIDENAKDFILFKTNLLLKDAKGDPIKKTEIIKDIVNSIAGIPDPLKRSVYVKECAHVLEMEEQVMINETNKIVRQKLNKRQQQDQIASPKTQQRLTEELLSLEPSPESGLGNIKVDRKQAVSNIEFQEKDIVRILIGSGGELFDKENNVTVAAYIVSNIEEVMDDFDNKLCGKIAKECLSLVTGKKSITTQYFTDHQDAEIRKFAIDLIHTPYEFSANWKKLWDIDLQTQPAPDENFLEDSINALNIFKLRKVEKMIVKNQQKLKGYTEDQDLKDFIKYQKIHLKLEAIKIEISKKLKIVISK